MKKRILITLAAAFFAAAALIYLYFTGEGEGAGIPCVDVGLPLKGMHTATEVLDLEDAESVASLVALFISTKDMTEVTA